MISRSRVQLKLWYETRHLFERISMWAQGIAERLDGIQPVSQEVKALIEANGSLKNAYRGRRAFVIGNGPSLAKQDLALLEGELTITCNAFFLHPVLRNWCPTFHSNMDPNIFDGTVPLGNWFKETVAAMPDTMFFVPAQWHETIRTKHLFPGARTHYIAFAGMASNGVNSVDITRPIPGPQSVSVFNLMLAVYLGCSPIYLLGMDHDWLATRNYETHFYQSVGTSINGMTVAADLSEIPYDSSLASLLRLWESYRHIQHYAEKRGVNIFNATEGGFLDVFPRVKYEELVVHRFFGEVLDQQKSK